MSHWSPNPPRFNPMLINQPLAASPGPLPHVDPFRPRFESQPTYLDAFKTLPVGVREDYPSALSRAVSHGYRPFSIFDK